MFCRRAWQRVGPLARRASTPTSRSAPVRHFGLGIPGGTSNMAYAILCGGGLTAAVVYAYKTVNSDSERYEDRLSNMGSAAEKAPAVVAPEADTPAAEPAPVVEAVSLVEDAAPATEVAAESVPAPAEAPVEEAAPAIEIVAESVPAPAEPASEVAAESVPAPAEPVEEAAPATEVAAESVPAPAEPVEEVAPATEVVPESVPAPEEPVVETAEETVAEVAVEAPEVISEPVPEGVAPVAAPEEMPAEPPTVESTGTADEASLSPPAEVEAAPAAEVAA